MALKSTLKAITIHDFGGPEVLNNEEVPVPEIGPDEALIKVHSCGVNPIDGRYARGTQRDESIMICL